MSMPMPSSFVAKNLLQQKVSLDAQLKQLDQRTASIESEYKMWSSLFDLGPLGPYADYDDYICDEVDITYGDLIEESEEDAKIALMERNSKLSQVEQERKRVKRQLEIVNQDMNRIRKQTYM